MGLSAKSSELTPSTGATISHAGRSTNSRGEFNSTTRVSGSHLFDGDRERLTRLGKELDL